IHMRSKKTLALLGSIALMGAAAAMSLAGGTWAATTSSQLTYIVLYKSNAVSSDAAAAVAKAGGALVQSYQDIGVVIARSANANFRTNILKDNRVGGAAATTHFAVRLNDDSNLNNSQSSPTPGTPVPGSDPLSGLQWDMDQINAPQARAINGGSPSIIVGDIDTGLDYTHPDLAANVDDANSANCVSGAPVQGKVAANDDHGHGTHTAGTIAAALNGIGIVGVAPNVKIAGI